MAGTTSKGFRFPQNADTPNVAVDIQNLASDIDTELSDYLLTATLTGATGSANNFVLTRDSGTASGFRYVDPNTLAGFSPFLLIGC
jgi:hypothetical protein